MDGSIVVFGSFGTYTQHAPTFSLDCLVEMETNDNRSTQKRPCSYTDCSVSYYHSLSLVMVMPLWV